MEKKTYGFKVTHVVGSIAKGGQNSKYCTCHMPCKQPLSLTIGAIPGSYCNAQEMSYGLLCSAAAWNGFRGKEEGPLTWHIVVPAVLIILPSLAILLHVVAILTCYSKEAEMAALLGR